MTPNAAEVLLVEDSPTDTELTLAAMRRAGATAFVAPDGVAALDYVFGTGRYANRSGQQFPKVILLDLKLPKVSGLEVLRRLKSDERTKAIPVVVLTSSGELRDVAESYRLGANSYVVKPLNAGEFSTTVSRLVRYWTSLNQPAP